MKLISIFLTLFGAESMKTEFVIFYKNSINISLYDTTARTNVIITPTSQPMATATAKPNILPAAVFDTAGAYSYTVPANLEATQMCVHIWGAGGGANINTVPPGGVGLGGAGAYVTGKLAITPGETLKLIVGKGGRPGGISTDRSSVQRANKFTVLSANHGSLKVGPIDIDSGEQLSVIIGGNFGGGGGSGLDKDGQGLLGSSAGASGGGRSAIQRFTNGAWVDIVSAGAGGGANGYNPFAQANPDPDLLYKERTYGYGGSAGLDSGCDAIYEMPDGLSSIIFGSIQFSGAISRSIPGKHSDDCDGLAPVIDLSGNMLFQYFHKAPACINIDCSCNTDTGGLGYGGDSSDCYYYGSGGGGGAAGGAGSCMYAGGGGSSDLSRLTQTDASQGGTCGYSSAVGQSSPFYDLVAAYGGSATSGSNGIGGDGLIVLEFVKDTDACSL